jgi:hypothetical protein
MMPERYSNALNSLADAFDAMFDLAKAGDDTALATCPKIGEAWVMVLSAAVAASNEVSKREVGE